MAGIGFVLQKVLKEGGISSFFKVAIAGTIIVAGPWLLSIIGIFVISQLSAGAYAESRGLFMAIVIYAYASSLVIFGGFHYIFTRQVADYIYEKRKADAGSTLILFSIVICVVASAISFIALSFVDFSHIHESSMFRISAMLLFVFINLIWILMIFISLLKRYVLIFVVYLVGMVVSIGGVFFLGKMYGAGGTMLAFTCGQFVVVLLLLILALSEYRPGVMKPRDSIRYFKRFRFLFLAGMFYYWGMWVDKIVFWFINGVRVGNSYFRVFDTYDIPVYLANLTMIPGLIYFIISSETDFYTSLMEFLKTLHNSIYRNIHSRKAKIIASIGEGLKEQTIFQGVFTLIFIFVAYEVSNRFFGGSIDPLILRITLGAVFFHLIFLTILVFLFYLQLYSYASISAFAFFLINLTGSIVIATFGLHRFFGASYLVAGVIGSIIGGVFLNYFGRRFDRLIYYTAATGE